MNHRFHFKEIKKLGTTLTTGDLKEDHNTVEITTDDDEMILELIIDQNNEKQVIIYKLPDNYKIGLNCLYEALADAERKIT